MSKQSAVAVRFTHITTFTKLNVEKTIVYHIGTLRTREISSRLEENSFKALTFLICRLAKLFRKYQKPYFLAASHWTMSSILKENI